LRRQLPNEAYSAILVFFTAEYDPHAFAAEVASQFPAIPVFGCTTAGEVGPQGIGDGGVIAIAFRAEDFSIVARPIADIEATAFERIRDHVVEARLALGELEKDA
jgi:hypothetical protein